MSKVVSLTEGARKRFAPHEQHPLDLMSFMRMGRNGRQFWAPPLTGDYNQNYLLGQVFGREMVSYIRDYEVEFPDPTILGCTVREMIALGSDGNNDGLICGFMRSITEAVMGRAVTS